MGFENKVISFLPVYIRISTAIMAHSLLDLHKISIMERDLVIKQFKTRAEAIFPEIVGIRRLLHAHPELAFEEHKTAAVVCEELSKLQIPYTSGIAKTGVVGIIDGEMPGPVIALRADMDALPIQEENTAAYCSQIPGKMHACGHDFHTASLLGTARILAENKHLIRGSIKLIFQPSEEKLPGGASVMIQEGVLKNPAVGSILGQHVMPYLNAGQIGIRSGRYMASTDEIYLHIHGKGGHGAQPHTTIDPVMVMAQILVSLQQVVSRAADPRMPSVLSFGKIQAAGATNIIPEKVYLEGTFRTYDEAWRSKAHALIQDITHNIAQAFGAKAELEIRRGYPVLYNDPDLTQNMRNAIVAFAGESQVVDLDLWTAAEDFAWYTQEIPGCFYRIGTRNEAKGFVHGLHTPQFDVDEDALKTSTGLMAWLAIQ
jgi:amidohydrolase